MTETPHIPGPLPKRRSVQGRRAAAARLQPHDVVWATLFAAGSLVVSTIAWHPVALSTVQPYLAATITFLVYVMAAFARDRIAAATAAAITACSPALAAGGTADLVFLALTAAALTLRLNSRQGLALTFSAASAIVHPVGGILCALLFCSDLWERKQEALISGALTFTATTVGIVLQAHFIHSEGPAFAWHPNVEALASLYGGAAGVLGWLAIPFLGELADPARRPRWTVPCLWFLFFVGGASLFHVSPAEPAVIAAPLTAVIAGTGFSRLMPAIASDFMTNRTRYATAVIAVAWLAIARFGTDMAFSTAHIAAAVSTKDTSSETPPPIMAKPATDSETTTTRHAAKSISPPHHPASPSKTTKALPPATSHATPPHAAPPTIALAASGVRQDFLSQAKALGVPITVRRWDGVMTPRTKWAIQWDIRQKLAAQQNRGVHH